MAEYTQEDRAFAQQVNSKLGNIASTDLGDFMNSAAVQQEARTNPEAQAELMGINTKIMQMVLKFEDDYKGACRKGPEAQMESLENFNKALEELDEQVKELAEKSTTEEQQNFLKEMLAKLAELLGISHKEAERVQVQEASQGIGSQISDIQSSLATGTVAAEEKLETETLEAASDMFKEAEREVEELDTYEAAANMFEQAEKEAAEIGASLKEAGVEAELDADPSSKSVQDKVAMFNDMSQDKGGPSR